MGAIFKPARTQNDSISNFVNNVRNISTHIMIIFLRRVQPANDLSPVSKNSCTRTLSTGHVSTLTFWEVGNCHLIFTPQLETAEYDGWKSECQKAKSDLAKRDLQFSLFTGCDSANENCTAAAMIKFLVILTPSHTTTAFCVQGASAGHEIWVENLGLKMSLKSQWKLVENSNSQNLHSG